MYSEQARVMPSPAYMLPLISMKVLSALLPVYPLQPVPVLLLPQQQWNAGTPPSSLIYVELRVFYLTYCAKFSASDEDPGARLIDVTTIVGRTYFIVVYGNQPFSTGYYQLDLGNILQPDSIYAW